MSNGVEQSFVMALAGVGESVVATDGIGSSGSKATKYVEKKAKEVLLKRLFPESSESLETKAINSALKSALKIVKEVIDTPAKITPLLEQLERDVRVASDEVAIERAHRSFATETVRTALNGVADVVLLPVEGVADIIYELSKAAYEHPDARLPIVIQEMQADFASFFYHHGHAERMLTGMRAVRDLVVDNIAGPIADGVMAMSQTEPLDSMVAVPKQYEEDAVPRPMASAPKKPDEKPRSAKSELDNEREAASLQRTVREADGTSQLPPQLAPRLFTSLPKAQASEAPARSTESGATQPATAEAPAAHAESSSDILRSPTMKAAMDRRVEQVVAKKARELWPSILADANIKLGLAPDVKKKHPSQIFFGSYVDSCGDFFKSLAEFDAACKKYEKDPTPENERTAIDKRGEALEYCAQVKAAGESDEAELFIRRPDGSLPSFDEVKRISISSIESSIDETMAAAILPKIQQHYPLLTPVEASEAVKIHVALVTEKLIQAPAEENKARHRTHTFGAVLEHLDGVFNPEAANAETILMLSKRREEELTAQLQRLDDINTQRGKEKAKPAATTVHISASEPAHPGAGITQEKAKEPAKAATTQPEKPEGAATAAVPSAKHAAASAPPAKAPTQSLPEISAAEAPAAAVAAALGGTAVFAALATEAATPSMNTIKTTVDELVGERHHHSTLGQTGAVVGQVVLAGSGAVGGGALGVGIAAAAGYTTSSSIVLSALGTLCASTTTIGTGATAITTLGPSAILAAPVLLSPPVLAAVGFGVAGLFIGRKLGYFGGAVAGGSIDKAMNG